MSEEEQVFQLVEERKARTKRFAEEKKIIKKFFLTIPNIYIPCKMKSRSIEVI